MALALSGASSVHAESAANKYQQPPEAVRQLIESGSIPAVASSPNGRWILLTQHAVGESVAHLEAARALSISDKLSINPITRTWPNDQHARGVGMTLVRIEDGAQWPLTVPANRLSSPVWSADSSRFIFRHTAATGVELWIGDVATRSVRKLVGPELNSLQSRGLPCTWMPDGSAVLCRMAVAVPTDRLGDIEQDAGPLISESQGSASRGLAGGGLTTAKAQFLYRSYWTVQPTLVDIRTGAQRAVGHPGIYETLLPSPDGRYVFAARIVEPYSSVYAPDFFPREFEVLDLQTDAVTAIGRRELTPIGQSINSIWIGYRRFSWAPAEAATLVFVEAQSSPGQPQAEAQDRVLRWRAPFSGSPREIFRSTDRLVNIAESVTFTSLRVQANFAWLEDGRAWIEGVDYGKSRKRIWLLDVSDDAASARLIADFRIERSDPDQGTPLLMTGAPEAGDSARAVIRQHGNSIYLTGGFAPEGKRSPEGIPWETGLAPSRRAFIDRFDLAKRARQRLYESPEGRSEDILNLVGRTHVVSRVETLLQSPHVKLIELRDRSSRDLIAPIELAPQLSGVTVRQLQYARKDGVGLVGTLLLPSGYEPGKRLPVLIWAYPMNLSPAVVRNGQAAPMRYSPHEFLWSLDEPLKLFTSSLLLSGYAVLWDPSIVVVGDRTRNDTAVAQMVASAEAAVAKLVEIGVADAERIAVAGQSYGGALTALLLANSRLFAAGIALQGPSNFTASAPMGMGHEERMLWEAPQAYTQLSSLFVADRITAPLLLIHGQLDPIVPASESRQLYAALNALGRTSRLVLLPHEGHAPQTKEAIGHVIWEIQSWLDSYL